MVTRFFPIIAIINLMTSLTMAADLQGQPDENCVLVQNNAYVTFGDIASALGRKVSARAQKITKFATSFSIQASDQIKANLLGRISIVVPIDGKNVVVKFIERPKRQGTLNDQEWTSQDFDLIGLVSNLELEPGWKMHEVAHMLASNLHTAVDCSDIKVTFEAEWLKVPFLKPHYAANALKSSHLEITDRSGNTFSLMLKAIPQGNSWIYPARIVNSAHSSRNLLDLSSTQGADHPFITIYIPQNATLGEIFDLLGLPLWPEAQNILINGTVRLALDATKKLQFLLQVSLTLPNRDGFDQDRKIIFHD